MGTFGTVKLKKVIKFIEARGYHKTRQAGSHATYAKDGKDSITIALGQKDARHYTIEDVMSALNLTAQELKKQLDDF
jgi:predicted RNA binding protein YcfA (HicA-like mRNA interferase family)